MGDEVISVAVFLHRHPELSSKFIKRWIYQSRSNGLQASGIVVEISNLFRLHEQRFLDFLAANPGPPPVPPRKRGGLSIQALDGGRPPRLLPVLAEPVPPHGRPLSVFEIQELTDWGLATAGAPLRVAPTQTPGEHSLWRVHRHQVRRLPFLLTHFAGAPTAGGSWITSDQSEIPPSPPERIRKPKMKRSKQHDDAIDLHLAAQACTALTDDLVRICEKTAREQGLQRLELGSALLVAGVEMFIRDAGVQAAQTALRAALRKLAEDQQQTQSVN
jgi:hypothetical protein